MIDATTGEVDRKALAGVVFSDRSALDRLEAILHPRVLRDQEAFIARSGDGGAEAVVIDAPLLLEAGFGRHCDSIVYVEASEATRVARVEKSRGWTPEEFHQREASQWPMERKRAHADHIVMNEDENGSIESRIRSILGSMLCKDSGDGLSDRVDPS